MRPYKYEVKLTNGVVEHTYYITAMSGSAAIILAQAEAINNARGYELVSCEELD